MAEELGVVGLLAVELFETANGVVVNELAMRPHNSGHWTIEGSRTSQFEQHLRAVLDSPLGATDLAAPAVVMANILGAQDAPNGLAGAAAIHARLADGTPVEVERMQLQEPISTQFGGEGPQRPMTRRDLQTGSVLVTIAGAGYGWGPDIPADANVALVVTPTGEYTYWAAPLSVPLDTVRSWAEAADRG